MPKLKSLEGLRGVAAAAVVVFHLLINYFPAAILGEKNQLKFSNNIELIFATTPLGVMWNGNFAVCIFFVLSGFVLSYKFFVTQNNQVIVATAFRRYFRLAIPVLFSLIPIYLFSVLYPALSPFRHISILDVLYEGVFATFFRYKATYNTVLWTMTYEFFGSFLVFGFCLVIGHTKNRLFAYIVLIIALWNTYFLAFVTGILLSDLYVHQGNYLKNGVLKVSLVLLALFFGSYPDTLGLVPHAITVKSTMYSFLSFGTDSGAFYHVLGATILLLVLLNSQRLDEFFSRRTLQALGKGSFSLYLMHAFIIVFISHILFNYFKQEFNLGYKLDFLAVAVISLMIISLVTYITYRFVDRSAIHFSEYVYTTVFGEDGNNNMVDLKFLKDAITGLKETNLFSHIRNPIDGVRDDPLQDHDES